MRTRKAIGEGRRVRRGLPSECNRSFQEEEKVVEGRCGADDVFKVEVDVIIGEVNIFEMYDSDSLSTEGGWRQMQVSGKMVAMEMKRHIHLHHRVHY